VGIILFPPILQTIERRNIMKRSIIITLVMVLVCVSAAFAGNVDGINNSKWGSDIITVYENENVQGGVFYQKGMNAKGLFEVQFESESDMGSVLSMYVFDKNNKLIYGGLIITMNENRWIQYYHNYHAIVDMLTIAYKEAPKYDYCSEIIAIDGMEMSCEARQAFVGEHIALKKVKLYNEFNTNHTKAVVELIGERDFMASIIINLQAVN